MSDKEENLSMLQEIHDRLDEGLIAVTEWESIFLESINEQVKRNVGLTNKQSDIFDEIWRRCHE